MLYVDVLTQSELKQLVSARADACVSLYLPTTPQTQHVGASRIAYRNLVNQALDQLSASGFPKRRAAQLQEQLEDLAHDEEFWTNQANSLGVLATPDNIRTYRLATAVKQGMQVADRFELKPLIRGVAFPQTALVLALSENAVRLLEIFPDMPPALIRPSGMPQNASDAVGKASINNLPQNTRISNAQGQKFLLRQYARKVDASLRTLLGGRDIPLILAATKPIEPIFRNICSYPGLLSEGIVSSPDRQSEAQLAEAARPVLDAHYRRQVDKLRSLFDQRSGSRRTTTDIQEAARAATNGAIEWLMVDLDCNLPGTVSDSDGTVTLAKSADASNYDVVDEIAGRALLSGAHLLGVRSADVPEKAALAAILRYPI
jgi:hypothetical protein